MSKSKARKKKKTVLSSAEKKIKKLQRDQIRQIRQVFRNAGFLHIPEMENKDLVFQDGKTDFDDFFLLENVVILLEYTISNEANVSDHLLKKNWVFDKIRGNQQDFTRYLRENFTAFSSAVNPIYDDHHFNIVILYASRFDVKPTTKIKAPNIIFFDYAYVKYFLNVSNTLKKSSKYEILEFLGISSSNFSSEAVSAGSIPSLSYKGSVLPEANSHFPPGYKVVSFYVDPAALLSRAYVLRRDGWRTGGNIYQRMISRAKVEAIRKHLLDKKGVFINNIIVTLPDDTKLLDGDGKTIDTSIIQKTTPGTVNITSGFNSIGIVDGQHRVFSYYEGGAEETQIGKLRIQQNLLATGILFPDKTTEAAKAQFEARLFLEINSNQSSARAELKQEIGLILKPFSTDSIARAVLIRLNEGTGALSGEFQKYFWENNKVKTTTIVSYGLKPLVRVGSDEGLFSRWANPKKDELSKESDVELLDDYISYCAKEIGTFVSAAKVSLPADKWTTDKKVEGRLLTTTVINGLIACVRQLAINDKLQTFLDYKAKMKGFPEFDFRSYKSSSYNNMGSHLYQTFFASP